MVRLSNSIGQKWKSGRSVAGGVGGDDGAVPATGGVEIDVVGERDLDDPVDARRGVIADGRDRVGDVERDGSGRGGRRTDRSRSPVRRTVLITVAPAQCASWAASEPTAPSAPWTSTVAAGDRAVGEHGAVGRDARDPEAGARSRSSTSSGSVDRGGLRNDGELRSSAERPVGLGVVDPDPLPEPVLRRRPRPPASMTPAPSLCGITRGNGIAEPKLARPLLGVAGVDPGEPEPDPDLTGSGLGIRQLADLQHLAPPGPAGRSRQLSSCDVPFRAVVSGLAVVELTSQPAALGRAGGSGDHEQPLAVGVRHVALPQGRVTVVEEAGRLIEEREAASEHLVPFVGVGQERQERQHHEKSGQIGDVDLRRVPQPAFEILPPRRGQGQHVPLAPPCPPRGVVPAGRRGPGG